MANDNNKEPKVHGSGSMFVDAAIEALQQEREKDKEFSFMLITNRKDKCGRTIDGQKTDLMYAIAANMEDDEDFEALMKGSLLMCECHKNPKEMLNKFFGILDKAVGNSKEPPLDALKGFFDKLKKDEEE